MLLEKKNTLVSVAESIHFIFSVRGLWYVTGSQLIKVSAHAPLKGEESIKVSVKFDFLHHFTWRLMSELTTAELHMLESGCYSATSYKTTSPFPQSASSNCSTPKSKPLKCGCRQGICRCNTAKTVGSCGCACNVNHQRPSSAKDKIRSPSPYNNY